MLTRTLSPLLLGATLSVLNAALASPAGAQVAVTDPQAPAFVVELAPSWRVDIDIFTPGAGHTSGDGDGMIAGQLGVRFAVEAGHGFFANTGLFSLLTPTYALVESGYLYRVRLSGDDRLGFGLDLSAGLSAGVGNSDSNGDGARVGANVGASLDARLTGFVIGLEGRTRLLGSQRNAEVVSTLMLRITFGFWG